MRKSDAFSIVVDSTRTGIIRRLEEAKKAAYSDLLDSIECPRPIASTGTFNYHLNVLLKNEVIEKNGAVYRLTDKGRELAHFIREADQLWDKLESKMRGIRMSIFSYAEQFEAETGTKMQKTVATLGKDHDDIDNTDIIMDEREVLGIITVNDCNNPYFRPYQQLCIEDFQLQLISCKSNKKKPTKELVLTHPDLDYHISPNLLGIVYQFLERIYEDVQILASIKKPAPFLLKPIIKTTDSNGCAFLVAPCV